MPLLEIAALDAFYGDLQALSGIALEVSAGEIVAVIGANGAGKTTLIRSILGLVPRRRGEIAFDGAAIDRLPPHRIARLGIAPVPEGRRLFPSLSTEENLLAGGGTGRTGPWTLARVYDLFPMLRELRGHDVTRLSGGQQQMVAIGRALLANPRLLLCDELSLGLAPKVVGELYAQFGRIREEGTAIVLVEQDVVRACDTAHRFYCLLEGRVALSGHRGSHSLQDISRHYFGQ